MAAPKITTGYTQPGTKLIVKPNISNYKDTKKYQAALNDFYAKSTDPEAVKYRTDELTKKYGSLKDADGKAIFTPTYIKALAEGVEPPASLDKAVTDWATAKMKEATNYDWDNFSGGIGSVAAQNLLSSFVKDPSQVDSALTFKSSGVELTPEQKEANTKALEDKAAKAEKDTAALENYDPNAGTWDPSKNTVDTPFGNMLSGLVSGYKNPYAADYVNPLTAVEKPTLTNIKTPFKNNAIPQDLVNLFNSAGTDYAGGNNPQTKGTSLGSKMLKLYQPSTTDSSGQLAKPGAPDTTNTSLPKITGDGTTVVNSNGSTAIGGGNVSTGEKPSTPQYTAGDYIEPSTRAAFANNPALADQIAWSAAQDAAKQPQTSQVSGITALPANTPNDFNPAYTVDALKLALAERAKVDNANALVGNTITTNENLRAAANPLNTPNLSSVLSTQNMNSNVGGVPDLLRSPQSAGYNADVAVNPTTGQSIGGTRVNFGDTAVVRQPAVVTQPVVTQPVVTQPVAVAPVSQSAGRNADVAVNPTTGQSISGTRVKF